MTKRHKIAYGGHPSQFGHLYVPEQPVASAPLVVLVHGGYWSTDFALTIQTRIARDLAARGAVVWNVEYRRQARDSSGGGGWPATRDDVAQAIAALEDSVPQALDSNTAKLMNTAHTAVVGHSAGGQLALCAVAALAGRRRTLRITDVVAQASVLDAVAAGQAGRGSLARFLGGSYVEVPERYREASPAHLPVIAAHVVAIHGAADTTVPAEMSRRYVEKVRAVGQSADYVLVPGGTHDDFVDPTSDAHRQTMRRLGI